MNKQSLTLLGTTVALIAAGALLLSHFQTHQKLGAPAVKPRPLPDSLNLEVLLPEKVLNYNSTAVEVSERETVLTELKVSRPRPFRSIEFALRV